MKNPNEKNSLYLFLAYGLTLVCVLLIASCCIPGSCRCCSATLSNWLMFHGAAVIFIFMVFFGAYSLWSDRRIRRLEEENKRLKNANENMGQVHITLNEEALNSVLTELKEYISVELKKSVLNDQLRIYKEHNQLLKDIIVGKE